MKTIITICLVSVFNLFIKYLLGTYYMPDPKSVSDITIKHLLFYYTFLWLYYCAILYLPQINQSTSCYSNPVAVVQKSLTDIIPHSSSMCTNVPVTSNHIINQNIFICKDLVNKEVLKMWLHLGVIISSMSDTFIFNKKGKLSEKH